MAHIKKRVRLALRRMARRRFGRDRDARIVADYLRGDGERKLQIGCGPRILDGWLNADFYPKTADVLHLDATAPLPFDDATFDFVFTEHMIEHVPFRQARDLVDECGRVLKPGGVARISTPDLESLVALYRPDEPPATPRSPIEQEFVDHFLRHEVKERREAPWPLDTFLINMFFRAWGHEFVYDFKTLRRMLEEAGCVDVVRCEVHESAHPALRGLENVDRKPPGHLAVESIVVEATRSAA